MYGSLYLHSLYLHRDLHCAQVASARSGISSAHPGYKDKVCTAALP